jgi:hypothetical protein
MHLSLVHPERAMLWYPPKGKGALPFCMDQLRKVQHEATKYPLKLGETPLTGVHIHFSCDTKGLNILLGQTEGHNVTWLSFLDEFFDTSTFELMATNTWLRKRTGLYWNLRICHSSEADRIYYQDISDVKEILRYLSSLGIHCDENFSQLTRFASIPTIRCTFQMQSSSLFYDICLLAPSKFYLVGTMSVSRDNEDDLSFLSELELVYPVQSKLAKFLTLLRPDEYKMLVDKQFAQDAGNYSDIPCQEEAPLSEDVLRMALCAGRDLVQNDELLGTPAFLSSLEAHNECYAAFGKQVIEVVEEW